MKHYNVIISIPVEIEVEIEAESDEVAQNLAADWVDGDPAEVIGAASFASYGRAEALESWELEEGQ